MARVKKAKKDVNPIDLREKVTLYAPADAKFHQPGEEIRIHPTQVAKFTKLGFTEEAPDLEEETTKSSKKKSKSKDEDEGAHTMTKGDSVK